MREKSARLRFYLTGPKQAIDARDSSIHHGTLTRTVRQRSLMSTTRTRRRVTSLVGAIVMLLPVSLAMAEGPTATRIGPSK